MFRAIGLSTRGRRSPTVVSPAAAAGANNVEGARASEEDPLAADDINNDDSSVESLTAAARNPEAAEEPIPWCGVHIAWNNCCIKTENAIAVKGWEQSTSSSTQASPPK